MASINIKFPLEKTRHYNSGSLDVEIVDKVDADNYGTCLDANAARTLARVLVTAAEAVDAIAAAEREITAQRKRAEEATATELHALTTEPAALTHDDLLPI